MIFGYLDPVTGSALLQVGLAALAAIGLGWQYVRKAARTMMTAIRGDDRLNQSDDTAAELTEVETSTS